MVSTNATVTALVVDYMHREKLSQQRLGDRIGLAQEAVSRRLRGATDWTLNDVDLLILAGVEIPALEHKEMEHEMKTITTIEQLEALPDGTILTASGRYPRGGTFTECAVRPVPSYITGTSDRLWHVLVFGAGMTESLVTAEHIDLPATLLHPVTFTDDDIEKAVALYRDAYSSAWRNDGEALPIASAIRAVLASIGEVQG